MDFRGYDRVAEFSLKGILKYGVMDGKEMWNPVIINGSMQEYAGQFYFVEYLEGEGIFTVTSSLHPHSFHF